jgi:PCFT/HCP family folate transporter-like MFS transporter 1/3
MYLFLYRLASNLPTIVTGLFFGVWSDQNGHRLPMVGSCIGTIVATLIYIGSMFVKSSIISIWVLLIGTLVQGFFGRAAVFNSAVNCLIAVESEEGNITKHTSMLFAMSYFGQCVGALLAGVIKKGLVPYLTVIGIGGAAVLVILVFVKNTERALEENASKIHENQQQYKSASEKNLKDIVDLKKMEAQNCKLNGNCIEQSITGNQKQPIRKPCLSFEGLRSYFYVLTRERTNVKSLFLAILIFLIFANGCDLKGTLDIFLLFVTRNPFNWTTSLYSYFLASESIIIGVVLLLIVPILSKKFKVSDFSLLVFGLLCKIIRYVATGFCKDTWILFALLAVWSFHSFTICLRSLLGKCVEQGELGKIYSIYSITETVSKLAGSVVYMSIYSATVSFDPRVSFFIMGFVNIVMLVMVVMSRRNFDRVNVFEMTPIIVNTQPSTNYTVEPDQRKTYKQEK